MFVCVMSKKSKFCGLFIYCVFCCCRCCCRFVLCCLFVFLVFICSFQGWEFETKTNFRHLKCVIRRLFLVCFYSQLSIDEALLGGQSWYAANLYRAVPRSRGLDAKRSSLSWHGPARWKSTLLLLRVSSIIVHWIFMRGTCSWSEPRFKHRLRQFGSQRKPSYIWIYKLLESNHN